MEYAIIVFRRENKIVLSILFYDIIIPHLFLSPGHVLHIEHYSMIGNRGRHGIAFNGKHMIVLHLEMSTVVIKALSAIPIVGGIDIEFTVKHVGRRVCHIILGE